MMKSLIWTIAAGFAVTTGMAHASGNIEVRLDAPAAKADYASGKIQFTLHNAGNAPVHVLKWSTPFDDSLGGLTADLFQVDGVDGKPATYVGKLAKRGEPRAQDYIVLDAGQSRTVTLDLSAEYDLGKGGQYSIRFAQPLEKLVASADADLIRKSAPQSAASATLDHTAQVDSNALMLWVNSGPDPLGLAQPLKRLAPAAAGNSFVSCSSTRQSQLTTARNSAVTYADNAKSYLNAGTQGTRYTWWFGTYDSSRYNTVKSHFTNISSALSTASYTFDCTCTDSGTYAYVYPNEPYRVYLCGAFWSAPNTGTDSRAGTLIHETSHFTVVAGTDDHVYGQTGAHSLAGSNPANAVDNADNHEYFGENTPARN